MIIFIKIMGILSKNSLKNHLGKLKFTKLKTKMIYITII